MANDEPFELSRRKALAGLGTIGVASAGAGLGTSAFFSDTESFDGNQLTAGELDLKVDWEEHYSDWSDDEGNLGDDDDSNDLDVQMSDPGDGYTPLPDPQNPLVWVADGDLSAFMDNTSVEAYPDTNDDGIQNPFSAKTNGVTVEGFCTDGADMSEDLDPNGGTGLRTNKVAGQVPRGEATVKSDGTPLPLVNIDDIKPGDFGEVTFSFHLCDNPGYVWLNGELVEAKENGVTEAEEPSDQNGDSTVELLDEIQTTFWYDDGDNVLGGGTGQQGTNQVDIAFLFDRSGSMSDDRNFLANNISNVVGQIDSSGLDAQFALVPYEEGNDSCPTVVATDLTPTPSLDFSYSTCGGTENASEAILKASDSLNWRSGSKRIYVVLTDEDDDGSSTERTNALNRIDSEDACLLAVSRNSNGSDELKTMTEQVQCGSWTDLGSGLSQQNIQDLVGFVQSVSGEEVFFRGTLREAVQALSSGNGIPLDGNTQTAFDETGDPEDSNARECYMAGMSNYIGFAWYVPTSVGNQIQSDSVSFDLGFYTEQCRHNDGSGQA